MYRGARALGPGLLESVYDACLERELLLRGLRFERQKPLPVRYKGVTLECGYRMDFVVQAELVVEVKAVELLLPVRAAQLIKSDGGFVQQSTKTISVS